MHILKSRHYFIVIALLLLFTPNMSSGHGLGVSYEETVDGYFVDVGYDPEIITTESRVRLEFDITNEETGETNEYSDLWLRINKDKQTVFAGGVHKPDFGNAGVLYTFPEDGLYEVSVRYQNNGEKLTEVKFPLNVNSVAESTSTSTLLMTGLVGLILGGIATFILMRRRSV